MQGRFRIRKIGRGRGLSTDSPGVAGGSEGSASPEYVLWDDGDLLLWDDGTQMVWS